MAGLSASDICVLIPAYNEEKNIVRVAEEAKSLGFHVLVVDDGSTDGTAEKIKNLGIHCIISPVNQGKGASLRKGMEWFLRQNIPGLILMDADGQHDPQELSAFTKALNENSADLVIGDRMHNPKNMPWLRRLTNRVMSWLISAIARQQIPDSQCGYRAIKKSALDKIRLSTDNFEIESEMILKAASQDLKIRSIPIRSVYESGKSHIRPLQDTLRFLSFIARFLLHNN